MSELIGLRLLLVDDDLDSREVVSTILSHRGIDVTSALDAERALDVLNTKPIDVIISDVGLPGLDGHSFMKAVRAIPALTKTPAAALTAYGHSEDRSRALEAGFQMHLRKPFDRAELFSVNIDLAKIAAALNGPSA
jgi:CheY-like chemotaxis protein